MLSGQGLWVCLCDGMKVERERWRVEKGCAHCGSVFGVRYMEMDEVK